ncbi:MAG: hypothetical protein BJ554DRAFT_5676, partial [Olpidium bornovanus]
NGGRNLALLHGKHLRARWILPFDGNCFLTSRGFEAIIENLERHGASTKHFIVPMSRVINNTEILVPGNDAPPVAPAEPQLLFRADTNEAYSLNMRYGRRSKVNTACAAEGRPTAGMRAAPWEAQERTTDSPEKGNFRSAGWVYRLFSGEPSQEAPNRAASRNRAYKRLLAVADFLDAIDEGIARRTFRHSNLFLYNETRLRQFRLGVWAGDAAAQREVASVLEGAAGAAEAARIMGSRASACGDGVAAGRALRITDPGALDDVLRNITILALAHYFSGEVRHAHAGANLARMCLLGEPPKELEPDFGFEAVPFAISDETSLLGPAAAVPATFSCPTPAARRPDVFDTANGAAAAGAGSESWRWFVDPEALSKVDVSHALDGFRLLRRAKALTQRELAAL